MRSEQDNRRVGLKVQRFSNSSNMTLILFSLKIKTSYIVILIPKIIHFPEKYFELIAIRGFGVLGFWGDDIQHLGHPSHLRLPGQGGEDGENRTPSRPGRL